MQNETLLQNLRASKTTEVEFEFITWVLSEATTDFLSSSGRPSFSLFVDICLQMICKWAVGENPPLKWWLAVASNETQGDELKL